MTCEKKVAAAIRETATAMVVHLDQPPHPLPL